MHTYSDGRNWPLPAFYMLVNVVCFSFIPVMFKLGGADESPFFFTGTLLIFAGVFIGVIVLIFKSRLRVRPTAYQGVKSNCLTWSMLFAVIASFDFVLFAVGLAIVDVAIAAILYETWPVFLMLLMSFLFYDKTRKKDDQRYDQISTGTWIFVGIALAGVALVILSHNDVPSPLREIGSTFTDSRTLIGVAIVLLAAFFAAARPALTSKIGEQIASEQSLTERGAIEEIAFATVVTCICNIFVGVLLLAIGAAMAESFSSHHLFYAVSSGFVNSITIIAFRAAILKTNDLGVNAIGYGTPLITLIWLWALSILDVLHIDYLIIGAMGIVAANLLINVKASERIAYKALVVSLWVFGTITYFTDGYATDVPLELPVTIYILVLSFRVERLARRTTEEEGLVFDVFRKLRAMSASQESPHSAASKALVLASRSLLDIDHYKSAEALKNAYENMLEHLENARRAGITPDDITEICRMVDKLAHSRQQGSRFGEIVAIALTGMFIVLGLLFFSGEREVYGEIASFVLPSVVVFLFFNIVDLQRDRKDETLVTGKKGRYIVNFGEVKDREAQQHISMAISAGIVIVFVVLFFAKG